MASAKRLCVIMAGGSGERFWPLSRRLRPKQLLRLSHPDRNLLEETVHRIAPLIPAEKVYIATAKHLQGPIRQELRGLPERNVLAEPCKRNTAGCLAYVTAHLLAEFGEEAQASSVAVLSADHRIGDDEAFRRVVDTALSAAEKDACIAVVGARPSRPETGYGYIELANDAVVPASGVEAGAVYPVAGFREKPDAATAAEFVDSGRFLWNTGMFFWRIGHFLDELAEASPAHTDAIYAMAQALRAGNEARVEEIFQGLEDISIDFALMEKARRVVVAATDFDWDDIGAWDALHRAMGHDPEGNVAVGEPILVDTRNSVVYNEVGKERMAVAVIGVEGLTVVVREDGVLVVPTERAQDVRRAVQVLKERGSSQI